MSDNLVWVVIITLCFVSCNFDKAVRTYKEVNSCPKIEAGK